VFRGPLAGTFKSSLSMRARWGRSPEMRPLEDPCPARASAFVARESASPNQHDDDHNYQDKQNCSSSNKHGFLLSLGGCRASEFAVRAESTLGLGSVSGSIGTV
jgi:hypothetical protein